MGCRIALWERVLGLAPNYQWPVKVLAVSGVYESWPEPFFHFQLGAERSRHRPFRVLGPRLVQRSLLRARKGYVFSWPSYTTSFWPPAGATSGSWWNSGIVTGVFELIIGP